MFRKSGASRIIWCRYCSSIETIFYYIEASQIFLYLMDGEEFIIPLSRGSRYIVGSWMNTLLLRPCAAEGYAGGARDSALHRNTTSYKMRRRTSFLRRLRYYRNNRRNSSSYASGWPVLKKCPFPSFCTSRT